MILGRETLAGIEQGSISLVFRRWKRPGVRTGGSLMTAIGRLRIESVRPVDMGEISNGEAELAGYPSRDVLLAQLERWEGQVYRIAIAAVEPDPRVQLRSTPATGSELESLLRRLARLDGSSASGAWTRSTLELIEGNAAVRARDLADRVGLERLRFKQNVRKLKALGLTESLPVGYRLSPRGQSVLDRLHATEALPRAEGQGPPG